MAQKNFPDIIQIGDVTKLNFADYKDVDIIIGGSPCQDLSIAKQNREGLHGERSRLFWDFIKALSVIKPKFFLLENVASMKDDDRDAITTQNNSSIFGLGVVPVRPIVSLALLG